MTSLTNAYITIDLEPVVKLGCEAFDCQHNLANSPRPEERQACCELKHLEIGKDGKCRRYIAV